MWDGKDPGKTCLLKKITIRDKIFHKAKGNTFYIHLRQNVLHTLFESKPGRNEEMIVKV